MGKTVFVVEETHYEGNSVEIFSSLKKARKYLARHLADKWERMMRNHSNSTNPRDRQFDEWYYHGEIPKDADEDWFFDVLHNTKHCPGCRCDTDCVVFSGNGDYHAMSIREEKVQ